MFPAERKQLELLALIGSELGKIAKEVPEAKRGTDDLQGLLIAFVA